MRRRLFSCVGLLAALAGPALAGDSPGAASPPGPEPAEPALTYGGSADFYFAHNLNEPRRGRNRFHLFDYRHEGGPHLGMLDLWVEHRREPVGFRLDLNWGPSAHIANAAEPTDDLLWEHVQQVYLGVNLTGDGRTFAEIGKWVTPAGAEVSEAVDNVFHSQGLLFALSAPFYHLGVRVQHDFTETEYLLAHVHRGWDAVSSPGHDPGFGVTYGRGLGPWTGTLSYLGGPEPAGGGRVGWRHFMDLIAEYEPENSRWSGLVNAQYGRQRNARPGETADWTGLLGLARYELDARHAVAARAEWVRDGDRFLTRGGADLASLGVNYTRAVNRHLQFRLEYRHELAGRVRPFPGSRRGQRGADQGVIGLSAVLGF
jgi:hypothetical protein